MYILAIESSCDETAAAIVKDGRIVLSNIIYSQIDIHSKYGGVVPEVASRKHIECISRIVDEAILKSGISKMDINAVAATCAPGLIGALLVGVNFAKSFAYALNIPFIPVHHLRGHIAANYIAFKDLKPPFLGIIVSGGHSMIVKVNAYTDIDIIGSTADDAAGEAFDKIARALGFEYPGGKKIEQLSRTGDENKYHIPRARVKNRPLDFSFSGVKTHVINLINNAKENDLDINSLAASLQLAISDAILERIKLAVDATGIRTICISGGVAANSKIRQDIQKFSDSGYIELFLLPKELCADNAAMIGCAGYYEFLSGSVGDVYQNAFSNMDISCKF